MARFKGPMWANMMSTCQTKFSTDEGANLDLNTFRFSLKKLLEQKSLSHWHHHFLAKYIESGTNPYGLRIQKFPNLPKISDTLKKKWEDNLQMCTRNIMVLLMEEYDNSLKDIDKEIDELYMKNEHLASQESFIETEAKVQEEIENLNRNILLGKEKKFRKDGRAFQEGKAYKWNNQNQGGSGRSGKKWTNPNSKLGSERGDSSSQSSSTISIPSLQDPYPNRRPKNKPGKGRDRGAERNPPNEKQDKNKNPKTRGRQENNPADRGLVGATCRNYDTTDEEGGDDPSSTNTRDFLGRGGGATDQMVTRSNAKTIP